MVQYRLARPKDAVALAVVRQRSWESAYRGIYPDKMLEQFDYAGHAQRFLNQIGNPDIDVYIIQDGEQAVGYFTLCLSQNRACPGIPVALGSLYLIPAYHRRGIGTQVMEFTRQWCRERGHHAFYNSCNLHNHGARAFYEAMGGVLGAVDDGYEDPAADQCYYEYTV